MLYRLPRIDGNIAVLSMPAMSIQTSYADCTHRIVRKQHAWETMPGVFAVQIAIFSVIRLEGCKNWASDHNSRVQYDEGSAPALALDATIQRTNNRFANYAKAGLLCGTDGLPHLIADPGLALRYGHAGEVFVRSWSLHAVSSFALLSDSAICKLFRKLLCTACVHSC